jgi:hypothetical protein
MSDGVVQIGEYIAKRKTSQYCQHRKILYDQQNQTTECADCKEQISPFVAFMCLVRQQDYLHDYWRRRKQEVEELEKRTIVLKAARKAEIAWRKRDWVPNCPHCAEPIFPGDGFGDHSSNKKRAIERRKFTGKEPIPEN